MVLKAMGSNKKTDDGYLLYVSSDTPSKQDDDAVTKQTDTVKKATGILGLPFPSFKEVPMFYVCKRTH